MKERKKEKKEKKRLPTIKIDLQSKLTQQPYKRELQPSKESYYHPKRSTEVSFDDYLSLLMVVGLFCRAVV